MIASTKNKAFKIAVLCGGPSGERGISLNSARSIMDHLSNELIQILPFYVDSKKNFFQLSPAQLYSNTPADFDFKLQDTATLLNADQLAQALRNVDLVFPAIHGAFGEGGELQDLLEKLGVPFIGSNSQTCRSMFYKDSAANVLREHHYPTIPSIVLKKNSTENEIRIHEFFQQQHLTRAVVKPLAGGSSIGVHAVNTVQDALSKAQLIFDENIDDSVLLEPFISGKEFTILILQNQSNETVALLPTQVDILHSDSGIFDYRRKYLPTNNTFYHTPAKFDDALITKIRSQAEDIFNIFNMRDFARLDGWVVNDSEIYFTDFNPITGLEQNSFIFRQAAILGLTHRATLEYVVKAACKRNQLHFPEHVAKSEYVDKKNVYVLFGGSTAERQVSLMSGTNVWLKLLNSNLYQPQPFFLDSNNNVWEIPYSYALNHTAEEVFINCQNAQQHATHIAAHAPNIQKKLGITENHTIAAISPKPLSLNDFVELAQDNDAFIFIALHGGDGENGILQQFLEQHQLLHNGSKASASHLCMDKYETRQQLNRLAHPDIIDLAQKNISIEEFNNFSREDFSNFWQNLCLETKFKNFIIKPRTDGCSAGITLLTSAEELAHYAHHFKIKAPFIGKNTFSQQLDIVELPMHVDTFLLEPYIEVDKIFVDEQQLIHQAKQGWIELTVGIIEQRKQYHAFNPSLTIASGATLSLEEKFQGGTGINITPPPKEIIADSDRQKIQRVMVDVARALGIENYARIDIFYNRITQKIIVIEVNTLPGLTPSTVIYHQALAETPSLPPQQFLEQLIANAMATTPLPATETLQRTE